jgi:hypothetical protein
MKRFKMYQDGRFVKNIESKTLASASRKAGIVNLEFLKDMSGSFERATAIEVNVYDPANNGVFEQDIHWQELDTKAKNILKKHGLTVGGNYTTKALDFDLINTDAIDHLIVNEVIDEDDLVAFYDSQFWREWRLK